MCMHVYYANGYLYFLCRNDIYQFIKHLPIIYHIKYLTSQKYFDTRPIESRLAAWASEQSKTIPGRDYLDAKFEIFKREFKGKQIPLPPDWGGFRLVPEYFEFWQGRESRLHDRICYKKSKSSWKIFRLAP